MPFTPAPGVAQINLRGHWNNVVEVVTVWHVYRQGELASGAWDAAALQAAANRCSGAMSLLLAHAVDDLKYTSIVARDLTTSEGVVAEVAVALAGVSTGTPTGPMVGPIVQWKTGLAGRSSGRTFLAGTNETNIDDNGQVASTFAAALRTSAINAIAKLKLATSAQEPGAPLQLCICPANPVPGQSIRVPKDVTTANVPAYPGLMRRRVVGR